MRLIHAESLELRTFDRTRIPPYAILSHTWGPEEIIFQEFQGHNVLDSAVLSTSSGYRKIRETCTLALSHGLEYAWIDTVCIDKLSSAELTESINSMFDWYRDAQICFVWLHDVEPQSDFEAALPQCRWLTRGWTLQELLAPQRVTFYDVSWKSRGSKQEWSRLLASITNITHDALLDSDYISRSSVAQRMSWASSRSTTRIEDIAYCLLGIFGVSMPLIYGEGRKAFRRLQEEVMKSSNDLTIFAWDNEPSDDLELLGVLAKSPTAFARSHEIRPFSNDQAEFSVTNRGLLMNGGVSSPPLCTARTTQRDGTTYTSYLLYLGTSMPGQLDPTDPHVPGGGIYLRKIGPTLFCRDSRYGLAGFGRHEIVDAHVTFDVPDYYILMDFPGVGMPAVLPLLYDYRKDCIHIPDDSDSMLLTRVAPGDLWDARDRIFLNPSTYPWDRDEHPTVLAMAFTVSFDGQDFKLAAICYHHSGGIVSKLVQHTENIQTGYSRLFDGRNKNRFMLWSDFANLAPEVIPLDNIVEPVRGANRYRISITFSVRQDETRKRNQKTRSVYVPNFHFDKL